MNIHYVFKMFSPFKKKTKSQTNKQYKYNISILFLYFGYLRGRPQKLISPILFII